MLFSPTFWPWIPRNTSAPSLVQMVGLSTEIMIPNEILLDLSIWTYLT